MKKYKSILIILLIFLICMISILLFKDEILTFVWVKQYESKYKDINLIEKTLNFNGSAVEESNIKIDDFQINLSDFTYDKDENKLDFNLKFENGKDLNNVGYILRVYNNNYCLGDSFNGYISLDSALEYCISYKKFYEENFDYKSNIIDIFNGQKSKYDLVGNFKVLKEDELTEDGSLIHHISYDLPEEFIISDKIKIELFDLNYQNVGDKQIYQVQKPLSQVRYIINLSEN